MVIRILDHIERASTYDDGEVIYRLICDPIARRETVVLSFDGVLAVPSAFVNAALVRLLESVPYEVVRQSLKIVGSTRQINELIKSRFEFVLTSASRTIV